MTSDVAPVEAFAPLFREAMASFPSGVTIVTTADDAGGWWGFTATSFCSLSLDPPLVLVCLAKSAQCYPAFLAARSWVAHVVPERHADLAVRFATRGADKFGADKFGAARFVPNHAGLPVFTGACAVLDCSAFAHYDGGDHTILVGRVADCHVREDRPAIYFRRDFHALPDRTP